MDDVRRDLPMAMIMAAFTGISWYIGVEINTSLFLLFKRRRGLYFWSCALCSWGVVLQPLFIILADFGVWTDAVPSIAMIYLTWLVMVVPQSWVLYSRLHLLMSTDTALRAIRLVLIFNSVVFSIPTMVIGTLAQSTSVNARLASVNLIWDRVQLVVFFVQETALSGLYLLQTRKFLQGRARLRARAWGDGADVGQARAREQKAVLWQLVYANALIIALDVTLLGIQCADLFHLQGAFKPCVYGIKLKVEFVILNRLIRTVRRPIAAAAAAGALPRGAAGPADSGEPSTGAGSGTRDDAAWHKALGADAADDDDYDEDGVQLARPHGRGTFRAHSGESQVPINRRSSMG